MQNEIKDMQSWQWIPPGCSIIEAKGLKALVRKGTSDSFVVKEVLTQNTYRRLGIRPNDIVLDVGMNIGMFSALALSRGASVYSFEPDPDNFKIALFNVKMNGFETEFYPTEAAVIGTADASRDFWINSKRNKGAHSLVQKRGRDSISVKCENINSVLSRVSPSVIKMDIEGGEYECLRAVKDLRSVREMIIEFHHAHLLDIESRSKYMEVVGILKKHFKHVHFRPETKKAWVTLIYCVNDYRLIL